MAKVKEFMTSKVITVEGGADVSTAAKLMRDHDIGILPVVDGGQLKGVVTDRDIVVKALAAGKADATVSSIASGQVISLSPEDDAKDAEKLMSDNDVRRLAVVDAGKVVGIVSVGDLAVRTDEKRAGNVMQQTGPKK